MKEPLKIKLWNSVRKALPPEQDFEPCMYAYLLDDIVEHGAVVIFPGGGYNKKMMPWEGEDVALKFNEYGLHAFVVDYRCDWGYPFPAPLEDALRAIKIIRGNARNWYVRPDHIATTGFSAGGHLCCLTGVWWDAVNADDGDVYDAMSARPDAVIPAYAVVSAFASSNPHRGSFYNLLANNNPAEEELHRFSCDEQVRPDSPPAFIWHTVSDQTVPWENSLLYAQACHKNGVPFEMHLYPYGYHGLGIGRADEFAEVRSWIPLVAEFMKKIPYRASGD